MQTVGLMKFGAIMNHESVLLDTSFFLRFLNDNDPLFKNADNYFRYFIERDITMIVSTISIAEYCVGGDSSELPLRNLQILPFNLNHAQRDGQFAKYIFSERQLGNIHLSDRKIISNDTKLFAQADSENSIKYYISSDHESKKIYDRIKQPLVPRFAFIDLSIPHSQFFGILDL